MTYEEITLRCPICNHTFKRKFPKIGDEIVVNNDTCPKCEAQAVIVE